MSDNMDNTTAMLCDLNITREEAKIYIELLKEASTHLRLSHITGINRTKVYRIIEQLEKRSLVARRTDDRGTFLVATDPATLEVEIVAQEEKIKNQRDVLAQLIPTLAALQTADNHSFVVRTYESVEGFKQMVWHELKTKGELLVLGRGMLEDFIPHSHWTEKHRALNVTAGYRIREIINAVHSSNLPTLPNNKDYLKLYTIRQISQKVLSLDHQIVIYNHTVAIYHWRKDQKIGIEIINKSLTQMYRQIFEHYWQKAGKESTIRW